MSRPRSATYVHDDTDSDCDEIHVTFKDHHDLKNHHAPKDYHAPKETDLPAVIIPPPSPLDTIAKPKRAYRKKTPEEKGDLLRGSQRDQGDLRKKRTSRTSSEHDSTKVSSSAGELSLQQKYDELQTKYQALEKECQFLQQERLHYGVALEEANKSIYLLLQRTK